MFCPKCGRANSTGRKFCASCGINLEAVSQALSEGEDDFFKKLDASFDHFFGRYSEHVFKNAPAHAADPGVGKSWRVLGQTIITSFVDLILFSLMWNIIPLRFLFLLISTPIRLLSERGKDSKTEAIDEGTPLDLPDAPPPRWLPGSVGSVTENTTTELLANSRSSKQDLR